MAEQQRDPARERYWRAQVSASPAAFVPMTVLAAMKVEVRCPSVHFVNMVNADRDTLRQRFAALAPEAAC